MEWLQVKWILQEIHDRKVSEEGEWLYKHLQHKMIRRKAKFLYLLQEDPFSLDQTARSHNYRRVTIQSWNHARTQISREGQPTMVGSIHSFRQRHLPQMTEGEC